MELFDNNLKSIIRQIFIMIHYDQFHHIQTQELMQYSRCFGNSPSRNLRPTFWKNFPETSSQ